ncbi:MAG: M16 family metallopeptidase [Desulfatibacillaceae bacterium]
MNPRNTLRLPVLLSAVLLILFLAGCTPRPTVLQVEGPPPRPAEQGWPWDESDLSPDPDLSFHTLDNGVRYIIRKNSEPRDRVALYLAIGAGSLHENEDQRGLAHFLEHMLFNGTEHFAPGEMVRFFQSIGMRFGPDANAYTGFDRTVYNVLLPDNDEAGMDKGLLVLEDYAAGGLLLPEEIEQEKGVVLAEMKARDSAGYRIFKRSFRHQLPGTRVAHRLPIGKEEVLKAADQAVVKSYYDTWYRPGNLVVSAVGDFDPAVVRRLIEKHFGRLRPRAPEQPEPWPGDVNHQGLKPFHYYDGEAGETDVTIATAVNVPEMTDTFAFQARRILENLANRVVQNRLNAIRERPGSPFTSATASSGRFLDVIKFADISATTDPDRWKEALATIEQELRRALVYGFTGPEVRRVSRESLAAMEKAAAQADTRQSGSLAHEYVATVLDGEVIQSPRQILERFGPVVEEATPEALLAAFRSAWPDDHRLVLVTGNTDIPATDREPKYVVAGVYEDSADTPVEPPSEEAALEFPYIEAPGRVGEVTHRVEHEDIGVTQVEFANGARLNMKRTDFKQNRIVFTLAFGSGGAGEPEDAPGLSSLAPSVVNGSGTGTLTREQMKRSLAGTSTSVGFSIDEEHFALGGSTVPGELELAFQLLYARLTDPGFREDAYKLAMERFAQSYEKLTHSVEGMAALHADRFFASGDTRFGMPPWDVFRTLTLDQVRRWVAPAMEKEPLELSIVGDFDPEKALALARRYVGGLPERPGVADPPRDRRVRFASGESRTLEAKTSIDKAMVIVGWPTDDIWDIHKARRNNVLADVFDNRLMERIREKMGATYSPSAWNHPSQAYPDYGLLRAAVIVDPDVSRDMVDIVRKIAQEMADSGISDSELERAKEPTVTSIKDMLRKNRYWLGTVLTGCTRHPEQLEWSRNIRDGYRSITKEDVNDRARAVFGGGAQPAWFVSRPADTGSR